MVDGNLALKMQDESNIDSVFMPDSLKYTSVSLTEVFANNMRFDASAFNLDAKAAKYKVTHCKYGYTNLWGVNGLVMDVFYGNRAKRNYVSKDTLGAIGFIGSSEMLEIYPKPFKFLSWDDKKVNESKVNEDWILISRSGTIGNVTMVNKTLSKLLVSEHAIRIIPQEFGGYIYAFLKTQVGKTLVSANTFGAVVDEIEPEHFRYIIIPNAPEEIKKQIHNLVMDSYDLRDQSNALMDEAEKILYQELQLPPIEELKPEYYDESVDLRNYTTKLSRLNLRLDCSYHTPLNKTIIALLATKSKCISLCGDTNIAKGIYLPTRFKRTFVESDYGLKMIGGKQINELIPNSEKYLAHSKLDDELKLIPNSILVTRSGTIGKTAIVPKHWSNWIGSDHIIRIVPSNDNIAGYLYCWLSTEYALQLIRRNTFGSVVDEIDEEQLSRVEIPILKNESKQKEINDKVLQANELRYQAYLKEQKAVKMMEELIE